MQTSEIPTGIGAEMFPTCYCTILINSAGHVTRYVPAEILNSAHERNVCYIDFFRQTGENGHISYPFRKPGGSTFQHFNILSTTQWLSTKKFFMIFYHFQSFFTIIQMNSALGKNDCYLCYISGIWEGLLRVTAELTKMVQYDHLILISWI